MIRKVVSAVCYLLYYGFARHLPRTEAPYNFGATRFRGLLCRGMMKRVGKDVNIQHGAKFAKIGEVEIGDHSGIGLNAHVGVVKIGDYVMMAPDVVILSNNHRFDRTDIPMCRQGFLPEQPVTIEDDVWIGQRVIILPGVRVGKGSILAAGAVVTKEVPPYSIVGGNPARLLKSRMEGQA